MVRGGRGCVVGLVRRRPRQVEAVGGGHAIVRSTGDSGIERSATFGSDAVRLGRLVAVQAVVGVAVRRVAVVMVEILVQFRCRSLPRRRVRATAAVRRLLAVDAENAVDGIGRVRRLVLRGRGHDHRGRLRRRRDAQCGLRRRRRRAARA